MSAINSLNVLLNDNNPITRIELGNEYDVPKWCFEGYCTLARREEPPSVDEGRRLGVDNVVKLGTIREKRLEERISWMKSRKRRESLGLEETPRGAGRTSSIDIEQLLDTKTKELVKTVFGDFRG